MTEMEDYELKNEYLHGRIEALEFVLKVVIATLPEEQRDYTLRRLSEFSRYTEEAASQRDTDPARDISAAVYDTNEYFQIRVIEEAEIYADES